MSYSSPLLYRSQKKIMVPTLLGFYPNLGMKNGKCNTVLHHITQATPVESVRCGINDVARLIEVNSLKWTLLTLAISGNMREFIEVLLGKLSVVALNISIDDERGTPRYAAYYENTSNIVPLLIDKGSDINDKCAGLPSTPLISGTSRALEDENGKRRELIRLLLDRGADQRK